MDKKQKDQFAQIFHLYYSPLCNYAMKVTGSDIMAEDIVQNLFIQLWQTNALENIQNPEAYLLRSVKFKCIDYFRKHKDDKVIGLDGLTDDMADSVNEISEDEIEPLLHYFAAKLPPKTRQVFLLSRQSGMTYRQIAEKLDISVKTVENQMGAALKQMRTILKENDFYLLLLYIYFF